MKDKPEKINRGMATYFLIFHDFPLNR